MTIEKQKRKNFSDIKKAFEESSTLLLTEEKDYKNSKQKLDCMCPSGHKYSISWNSFQQGLRCPYDSVLRMKDLSDRKKNKIKMVEVL